MPLSSRARKLRPITPRAPFTKPGRRRGRKSARIACRSRYRIRSCDAELVPGIAVLLSAQSAQALPGLQEPLLESFYLSGVQFRSLVRADAKSRNLFSE